MKNKKGDPASSYQLSTFGFRSFLFLPYIFRIQTGRGVSSGDFFFEMNEIEQSGG
jgi:hypothetical protein